MIKMWIRRICWMFKVKDCHHCCLWCEFYDICNAEEAGGKKK